MIRSFLRPALLAVGLFIFSVTAFCQTYPFARLQGYPVDTTGWFFAGDARLADTEGDTNSLADEIQLVPVQNTRSGAVYFKKPVNITSCQKWTAEFDFRIWEGTGADGIAFFFLNNPPQSYIAGGGMGIPPRPLGMMVCFDTWQNCSATTSGRVPKIQIRYETGLRNYSECPSPPQPTATNIASLRQPNYSHAKIVYDFGAISVYVNDSLRLTGSYDIQFAGYFGMTASTGGSTDRHSIRNFVLYTQRPLLAAPNAGADRTLCRNAGTELGIVETAANYSYRWFPTTGLSDPTVSNPQLQLDNPGNAPLRVKYFLTKDTVGSPEPRCAFADEVEITLLPALVPETPTRSVCSKVTTAVGFAPVQGASYQWQPPQFLSDPSQSNPTFLAFHADTADRELTYVVSASHPVGCAESDTIRIRQLGRFAQAGPDRSVCQSDTVRLGLPSKPGFNFSWFRLSIPEPGYESQILAPESSATPVFVQALDSVPRTLVFRQIVLRQDLNCLNDDTVRVRLFPQPRPRSLPPLALCPGQTGSIGSPAETGFLYQWMGISGADSSAPSRVLAGPDVAVSLDTLQIRTRKWADLPSCQRNDTVRIRFRQNPRIFAQPDQTACPGDTLLLGNAAFSGPGYEHSWTSGQLLSDSILPEVRFFTANLADTNFTFILQNTLESCTRTDTVQVEISPWPQFSATNPQRFCSGQAVTIGPDSVSGYQYTWAPDPGLNSLTKAQPAYQEIYAPALAETTRHLLVQTRDLATGCLRSDSLTLIRNPLPDAQAGPDFRVCAGDTGVAGFPTSPNDTYAWVGSGLLDPNQPATRFVPGFPAQTDTLTLVLVRTNSFGCADWDSVFAVRSALPVPPAVAGPDRVCAGDSVFRYAIQPNSGSQYAWSVQGGQIQDQGPDFARIRWSGSGSLAVTETDVWGCSATGPQRSITQLSIPSGGLEGPAWVCPGRYSAIYNLPSGIFPENTWVRGGMLVPGPGPGPEIRVLFDSSFTETYRVGYRPRSSEGCVGDSFELEVRSHRIEPTLIRASIDTPGELRVQTLPIEAEFQPRLYVLQDNREESLVPDAQGTTRLTGWNTRESIAVWLEATDRCGVPRLSPFHQTMGGKALPDLARPGSSFLLSWNAYEGPDVPVTYTVWQSFPQPDDPTAVLQLGETPLRTFRAEDFRPVSQPRFRILARWTAERYSWSDFFGPDLEKPEPFFPNLVLRHGAEENRTWKIGYADWYPGMEVKVLNRWGKAEWEGKPSEGDWNPARSGTYYFQAQAGGRTWTGWVQVMD